MIEENLVKLKGNAELERAELIGGLEKNKEMEAIVPLEKKKNGGYSLQNESNSSNVLE